MTQSHSHGFDIPAGAVRLASGVLYPNKAFLCGARTYAVQFHPEATCEGFRRWQDAPCPFYGRPGAQTREEQDALLARHHPRQVAWFDRFLRSLFGTAG